MTFYDETLAIIDRDVPHKLDADARSAPEEHVGESTASASLAGGSLS